MKNHPIVIDEEFRSLIPPMSADSLAQLERNIHAEGLRERLVLWRENDKSILIDGHHRYEILQKLMGESEPPSYNHQDIDLDDLLNANSSIFSNVPVALENREEVKLWILQNQIGRRNLTKEQRVEMVAKIVVLRQEQALAVSRANLKQGDAAPDVPKVVPSGKKTVRAAAKEFDVPRKPLQQAVTAIKDSQAKPTNCDICDQQFESKNAMKSHRNKQHAEVLAQQRPATNEPEPDPEMAEEFADTDIEPLAPVQSKPVQEDWRADAMKYMELSSKVALDPTTKIRSADPTQFGQSRGNGMGMTRLRNKGQSIRVRHSIGSSGSGPYTFTLRINGLHEREVLAILKFQEKQRERANHHLLDGYGGWMQGGGHYVPAYAEPYPKDHVCSKEYCGTTPTAAVQS